MSSHSKEPPKASRSAFWLRIIDQWCQSRISDEVLFLGSLSRPAMPVQMKLSRIIISEINEQQIIYLKEVEGERQFPIMIGLFEATSIDRRVKKAYPPPRPLTHDLLVNIVDQMGGELDSVVISELRNHTY